MSTLELSESTKQQWVQDLIDVLKVFDPINKTLVVWQTAQLNGQLYSKIQCALMQLYFNDAEVAIVNHIESNPNVTEEELKQVIAREIDFAYERAINAVSLQ
jgi:hypothetical protein